MGIECRAIGIFVSVELWVFSVELSEFCVELSEFFLVSSYGYLVSSYGNLVLVSSCWYLVSSYGNLVPTYRYLLEPATNRGKRLRDELSNPTRGISFS